MVGLNNHRLDDYFENSDGFLPIKKNHLALLVITSSMQTESITAPSKPVVIFMCRRYGFNIRHTLDLIDGLAEGVNSLIIDVDSYSNHLESIGLGYVGDE